MIQKTPASKWLLKGDLIREYLKREMRKRKWLAGQLEVSSSYLDQIIAGRKPHDRIVKRLCSILGVPKYRLIMPASKSAAKRRPDLTA